MPEFPWLTPLDCQFVLQMPTMLSTQLSECMKLYRYQYVYGEEAPPSRLSVDIRVSLNYILHFYKLFRPSSPI